ncbi:hypothetical protein ACHAPU_002236 [Fusarium lateritium]
MSALIYVASTVGGWITYLAFQYFTKIQRRPPGPKPFPLIGNLRDFPAPDVPEYQHWLQHKDLYRPVSSVTLLGTTLVIIHDKKAAQDLLEKASIKTSGRPSITFANKLCGYERIVLCQGYNILKTTYGYAVKSKGPDALVDLIEKMMTEFSLAAVPFAWLVDLIPIFQYVPESFPGAKFKQIARSWRESIVASAEIPYRFVQRQMATDNHRQSYVSKLLIKLKKENRQNKTLGSKDEEAIVWTAASLYGAAADTTVISLTTFTLAMVLFPEVQLKAQEEIDSQIGNKRFPSFEDRDRLPYVNAIVEETLRWWPIAPMGFPHTADQDIQYNNTHIPQGSYILPAVWWFLHDPAVYSEPDKFDPDRFLSPRNEPDPSLQAFGYGRRTCPGRFFADSSLYVNIVKSLAAFNIERARNENGEDIGVNFKPKPGILSYPTEFQFKVSPRSQLHVDLIRSLDVDLPREEVDAQLLETMNDWRESTRT